LLGSKLREQCLPLDTDQEDELVLGWDVERRVLLRKSRQANLLALGVSVFLDVLLSALEDNTTLLLVRLLTTSVIGLLPLADGVKQ
jgi:hypothetical protein